MTKKAEAARPQPQETMPAEMPRPTPPTLPQAGGSWLRRADGKLVREGDKER